MVVRPSARGSGGLWRVGPLGCVRTPYRGRLALPRYEGLPLAASAGLPLKIELVVAYPEEEHRPLAGGESQDRPMRILRVAHQHFCAGKCDIHASLFGAQTEAAVPPVHPLIVHRAHTPTQPRYRLCW